MKTLLAAIVASLIVLPSFAVANSAPTPVNAKCCCPTKCECKDCTCSKGGCKECNSCKDKK